MVVHKMSRIPEMPERSEAVRKDARQTKINVGWQLDVYKGKR